MQSSFSQGYISPISTPTKGRPEQQHQFHFNQTPSSSVFGFTSFNPSQMVSPTRSFLEPIKPRKMERPLAQLRSPTASRQARRDAYRENVRQKLREKQDVARDARIVNHEHKKDIKQMEQDLDPKDDRDEHQIHEEEMLEEMEKEMAYWEQEMEHLIQLEQEIDDDEFMEIDFDE